MFTQYSPTFMCSCRYVEAGDLEQSTAEEDPERFHAAWGKLCSGDGILVPGGFGNRGIEGKIAAIKWARTKKVPFLGICLGFQMAVIEFARNVLGWEVCHYVCDTEYYDCLSCLTALTSPSSDLICVHVRMDYDCLS